MFCFCFVHDFRRKVVVRAIKTLEAAFLAVSTLSSFEVYELSSEGLAMVAVGKTPEMALFQELTPEVYTSESLRECARVWMRGADDTRGATPKLRQPTTTQQHIKPSQTLQPHHTTSN